MFDTIIDFFTLTDTKVCAVEVWRSGSELIYQSDHEFTYAEAVYIGVTMQMDDPGVVYFISCVLGFLV